MSQDLLRKIVSILKISKGKNSKIRKNGELILIKKEVDTSFSSLFLLDEVKSMVNTMTLDEIKSKIIDLLTEWNSGESDVSALEPENEEQKEYITLKPFLNALTGEVELRDTKYGGISNIHIRAWLKSFKIGLKDIENSVDTLYPLYMPLTDDQIFKSEIEEIRSMALNVYSPPKWKIHELGEDNLPPLLKKFFNHLFPNEESRLAIYHHLYYLLTGRSQVLLCLAGRQAIGKSIFAETIVKAMIGRSNWAKAPRSFTKKEFNGFLKNRKAVVVEEIPLASSREERIGTNEMLKDILNDTITIEEKGQDSFTTQNYVTVFVTTNSPKAIPLVDMTDRRFLCLDITKVQLRKSMTQEEIEKLKDLNENSKEIADFCQWILKHGKIKNKDAFYCFTNELKKKIYFLTLSSWEIGILEWIDAVKSEYKFGIPMEQIVKEAKKHNSGKSVKLSTVEEFLNKHQLPSGNYIGDIDGGRLVLNDESMSSNISDNVKEIKKDVFGDSEEDEFDSFLESPKESNL